MTGLAEAWSSMTAYFSLICSSTSSSPSATSRLPMYSERSVPSPCASLAVRAMSSVQHSTGLTLERVSSSTASRLGMECGSQMARKMVPRTLNSGTTPRRRAVSWLSSRATPGS